MLNEPELKFIGNGWALLISPLITPCGTIPEDFKTDGFTLFWFLRWFHNPFGKGLAAAIWHDFALKQNNPRAHIQFYRLLRIDNVNKDKAMIMYIAVVNYARFKQLYYGVLHAISTKF